ncbi:MAG: LacI family DNA-binding transcriptional regulator [Streptosporangiales bacterium]
MAETDSQPTIRLVARNAGVSIASVSRVLNGRTASEATARRVHDAVAAVGYRPHWSAKSLKTSHTGQVAFAMEDIGNPAYLAMVRSIQTVLRASGYRLLLHSTGADVQDEVEVLRSLGERYMDGLIISPIRVTKQHLAALADAPAPVTVIGRVPDRIPVDNVRVDSRPGVLLALRHLADTSRRRVGFIDGPLDTVPGRTRHDGYTEAVEKLGLDADKTLVEFADFRMDGGARATRELLSRTQVDAIFAANDQMAIGAMRALRELGRRIPEDVAVVGMDDTDLATAAWPPLTSVSLGAAERGRLAAELLHARLDDPSRPPVRLSVEPSLIVRASSGPAAAA